MSVFEADFPTVNLVINVSSALRSLMKAGYTSADIVTSKLPSPVYMF